jgi:ligand-binding sensor domain-containing protein
MQSYPVKLLVNKILLTIAITALLSQGLYPQITYTSPEIFNEINGLPNNEVRCLLKDSKGYLWVGTSYGLAKYDGNKFSVFKHQSNRNSISGDVITTIFEDSKGNILVGANGLSILNRKRGVWLNYLHDPNNDWSIGNPTITSIAQENDSIYWIITSNGVNRFNIENGRFNRLKFELNTRIINSKVHTINSNNILISIGSSIYIYNIVLNSFDELKSVTGYSNALFFSKNIVGVKNPETNNYVLSRFNPTTDLETSILNFIDSNSLLFEHNGTLHLIFKDKILLFNSAFRLMETVVFGQQNDDSVTEYSCAIKEDNGTYWIGTTRGLLKIMGSTPFQFLDASSGLLHSYIRSLAVDKNNSLWIGVRQGPIYCIPKIDEYLKNRKGTIKTINFPTPNGEVYATNKILELRNGNIVFVTNRFLYHYNTKLNKFTDQYQVPNNHQYFSAIEVKDGILIGSLEKPTLFKILIENDRIRSDKNFKVSNSPDVVYTLFEDSNKQVWIGSEGLNKLTNNSKSKEYGIETAIPAINDTNYSSNSIWSLLEIDGKNLFVSTTNNGFYIYNKELNNFKHFGKTEGLSTDFTCTVLKDKKNNLWLSTKEGITYIDSTYQTLRNYPIKNGQYNSDFTFKCGAITGGNFILFGSKQGIVYFNPDSIKNNSIVSPLFVNEFRVFDRVARREVAHGDTIILKHDRNFFSFEFSQLDFRNPKEIIYNFQLLKYDKAEREVSNNFNSVSYTNVPPGNYTFRLNSYTSRNLNSPKTIEITLIIQPAFYQTGWFIVSIVLTIALIVASIIISIVRRQVLRARLQKMELDLLRSQINPHFIFNTLTSIQHTILTSSKNDAIDILSRFSRLMRMFLDYSRMEYIPLSKSILFYETFVAVHSVNLDEKIDFKLDVDKRIDPEKIKISPMLIQPFLENAIVHGLSPKGKDMRLRLEIHQQEGWLSCTIQDNGIGRKKAGEISLKKAKGHKSMGIEISSKSILLQLKKAKFIKESFSIVDNFDENGNASGTTVYLKIPYQV